LAALALCIKTLSRLTKKTNLKEKTDKEEFVNFKTLAKDVNLL